MITRKSEALIIISVAGTPLFNGESSLDQINLILNTVPVTPQCWKAVTHARCDDDRCCPDDEVYGMRENRGIPDLPLAELLSDTPPMGE